ncbi:MAG: response regulator transcription factor [Tenericutes bacterium]|nr:response regulator transcription factor [Mycoplasmatota bacterium]
MQKILIVDDEENIRKVIREYLEFEGFLCFEASNGEEAIKMCKENSYDLIVLDIMMPKIDGFTVAKEIRKKQSVPIIMLSARSEEYDKLYGFDVGIDDYVTKPFSPKELVARIKANLKRNTIMNEEISYLGLKIDTLGHNVYVDDKKINLTNKEYELLLYLIKNKNIVLTREQILNNVWNMDYLGEERTIDTHIKTLRSLLGKYKTLIVTVRGVGYKFEENGLV